MPLIALTASIAAGESVSNAVDFGANFVCGIIMPEAWTTAHCSVLVSLDNIKFFDLFSFDDLAGSTTPAEFKINVVPNAIVAVDPQRMLMGRYCKLRSGTRSQSVPQEAARVFTVIVNTKVTLLDMRPEGQPI